MRPLTRYRFILICTITSMSLLSSVAHAEKHPAPPVDAVLPTYHSMVPLGAIIYELHPRKRTFFVEATAVNEQFEGMQVREVADEKYVTDSSGVRVSRFPDQLSFRVATGLQIRHLQDKYRELVNAPCDIDYYLSHLQFRLKVFRGLKDRAVIPRSINIAGGPLDSKTKERMYEVSFETRNVRMEDRVVLEVLGPDGERIGKFHLDLY